MKIFTYVDNSNLFIEGRRLSAVRKGIDGVRTIYEAIKLKVFDNDWYIDYGRLHEFLCGTEQSEIAAGDKDYVPCIDDLTNDGFTVHVAFWGHAAREVKEAATNQIEIGGDAFLVYGDTEPDDGLYLDFIAKLRLRNPVSLLNLG